MKNEQDKSMKPKKLPLPKQTARSGTVGFLRAACAVRLLLLLLLTLPAAVQAQFLYAINNGTITITGYTGPGGAVIIPATINGLPVTSIGFQAFFGRTNLMSISIPNSVTGIGEHAFYSCTSLTSVTIPSSVTIIGNFAFFGCISLTSVTIPDSVTSIRYGAFYGCISLTSVNIPSSVTSIWDYAFNGCASLTSVTIPSSVANFRHGAFYGCTGLVGVYFQGDAPVISGFAVFEGNNAATIYYLPGTAGWGPTFGGRPTALWEPEFQASDTSFGVRTNQFGFNISWASGRVVVVEACTDLAQPLWTPVGTNTLTDGSSYFSDPQWTNHPARFYRLRSP